jgi:hypothetical protein
MLLEIEKALERWALDPSVEIVLLDAEGDRAFCAGGDVEELYRHGIAGDLSHGRRFWRDEYRINAMIANSAKPIVAFLQGFTMGGGVGIGCHGNFRIVCENSQIAMPECAIGLVPDVGGSFILAHAPNRIGEYLGLTGIRMDAGNAIRYGVLDGVLRCYLQGFGREIDGGDVASRQELGSFLSDGHCDASAAGANIDDVNRLLGGGCRTGIALVFLEAIEGFDHYVFCFAARNQACRGDLERQRVELFLADEVGDRFPGRATFDQVPEDGFDRFGWFFVERSVEVDALATAGLGEQHLGIEAGRGGTVFFEMLGRPLEQSQDCPRFGLRRAVATHGLRP